MKQSFKTQPALFATHELLDHPALSALEGIEGLIDWTALEPLLPQGEGRTGRPGYAAMTLFRALLLGIWHNLSDVKLEAQLARDLMFRKFCRLEMDQGVPQASTLGRFRIALEKTGHLDAVLTQINEQLSQSNVILQEGRVAIVDATLVEAAQSGLRKPDPEAGSHVKVNTKGKVQAKWGYQAFVNCDEDGFIFATALTPGNRHEINSLTDLLYGSEAALYADSAYSSQKVREWMTERGITDQVQRKGYRGRTLSATERARNVEIGVTRGRVEAIFGSMKRLWGMGRSRFMGLARTHAQFTLAAIGWNLTKGARFRKAYG
ncbi:hypothetical protein WH96_05970 [Kiloniella spongiae]|uniref:Transposase n=1 Tax=Kiloniella spongiae TaxID=1489064 RepID=A0A0H2MGV8_9PROT|nr:IS5 family transposase [Kiloniella spongiae]KLN61834.1 hypothetical protein WH96_05970 [Kiloniella spongiae]